MVIAAIPFWEDDMKFYAVHYNTIKELFHLETNEDVHDLIRNNRDVYQSTIDSRLVDIPEEYMEILREIDALGE